MKNRVNVVAHTPGGTKLLFSLTESKKSGDVILKLPRDSKVVTGKTLDELIRGPSHDEYIATDGEHVSLHCSPKSPDVNAIKKTYRTGPEGESSMHLTTAIKGGGGFAFVTFRACGALDRDRFSHVLTPQDFVLCDFSDQKDWLRFMVLVSHPDAIFQQEMDHPSNCESLLFCQFRITILWSFINTPSPPHSLNFHLQTTAETGPTGSLINLEAYNLYTELNMAISLRHLEFLKAQ